MTKGKTMKAGSKSKLGADVWEVVIMSVLLAVPIVLMGLLHPAAMAGAVAMLLYLTLFGAFSWRVGREYGVWTRRWWGLPPKKPSPLARRA